MHSPMTESASGLASELQAVPVFADLPEDDLVWLAGLMQVESLQSNAVYIREGEPADRLFIVLEGEMRSRRESAADGPTYVLEPGEVTGMLPFSRMREFPVTARSFGRSRVASLPASRFPDVLARLPQLQARLVGVMADRIREVAREDVQKDKLAALGKLSAGLAHELNNPAAAVNRAVDSLRYAVAGWQTATVRLETQGITAAQREVLAGLEATCRQHLEQRPVLDSLAQSDREDALATVLSSHGVEDAWRLAATLVDAGAGESDVTNLAAHFPGSLLTHALERFGCALAIERLLQDTQSSAGRISALVQSIKEYTYMDQAPVQDVDLHRGLENTLTILQHRLKNGVSVVRQYDCRIPRLSAHGSELNTAWTCLIENALDAMPQGGELRVRTLLEMGRALVEIIDTGAGIRPEIQDRIFEPFFTTKGVGEGTGLGLDTVYRIVRKHHGDVRFESRPGHTCFQVRLPLESGQ